MSELLKAFLASSGFIPQGHCYLWKPELVWLHVVSDSLIALAYYLIAIMLVYFVRKRRDVPFDWIFLLFGTFIVACGTTHLLEVWTLWHPTYWLSGLVKVITALVSLSTAVLLVPLISKALSLPSPAQLETANLALRNEITHRQETEQELQRANQQLEIRVYEHTVELATLNELLCAETAERQRIEQVLQESEQQFCAIFNLAAVGIAQVGIEGKWLLVNQKLCDIVGYTQEELLERTFQDITHPDDIETDLGYARQMLAGEIATYSMEKRYIRKDGSLVWINLNVSLVRNFLNEPQYFIGIIKDISASKKREEEIHLLQTITQAISESSDFDSALEVTLNKVCETTGWNFAEAWIPIPEKTTLKLSRGWYCSTPSLEKFRRFSEEFTFSLNTGIPGRVWASKQPEWIHDVSLQADTVFRRGQIVQEVGLKAALGVPIIADEQVLAIFVFFKFESSEEDKRLVDLVVSVANQLGLVIRRKRAEAALRENEQRFRAIFDRAAVGIAQVGIDGQWLLVNQKLCDIVGYTSEELLKLTFQDITHPDDLEICLEYGNRAMAGEIVSYSLEKRYICKDGNPVWINLTASLIRYSSGEPKYFIVVIEDISDRKRAEEALQRINEELELRVKERTAELLQTNEQLLAEIVERHRIEVSLRESEEKFRRIFNDAPIGIALARASDTQFVMVNPAFCQLLGYAESELLSRSCPAISYFEDLETEQPYAELMLRGESNGYQMEKRYVKNGGEIIWGNLTTTALRNPTGEVAYIFGMVEEITERKQAQEALRRAYDELELRVQERTVELAKVNASLQAEIVERKRAEEALWATNQRLQAVIKAAPVSIDILDLEGNVQLWNPAAEQMFGWSEQDVLGRRIPLIPIDQWEEFQTFLRTCFVEGKVATGLEVQRLRKDGSLVDVSLHTAPLRDAKGEIIGGMRIMTDISDRKRAENALKSLVAGTAAVTGAEFFCALVQHLTAALEVRYALVTEGIGDNLGRTRTLAFWAGDRLRENCEYDLTNTPCEMRITEGRTCCYPKDLQEVFPLDRDLLEMQAVYCLGVPLFNTSGKILGHLCIFDDKPLADEQRAKSIMSIFAARAAAELERKQAQEELQKSYNLLRSVIEGTPDAILVKDIQGRYVMLNSAVARIQGKPKSEILGRDDIELFGHETALPIMENDRRIMSRRETEMLEEDVLIEGTLQTYLSTKSVWQDAQGNVIGLIVMARDITHRKRVEQEIRELNQNLERRVAERTAELEAANQELEAFSYSVSHDLRAPLRGIDGFSQALLDSYADKLDDKGKHYLQRIRAGTQRMGELIDDLLKLSRITRSEMHRAKVDLSAMATTIAAELHSTQPERQVEFVIASGLIADGDSRLLRIVLENLLNNSWKFTSSCIQTHIEFGVIVQPGAKSAFFVRDNGAGFDMAYANKLFGAFVRLHSTTQFPGTGIGLATVQRIIHRHGGRVWAQGAVEQGATFYFTL
jgi:PAS domain S-box-containing protein